MERGSEDSLAEVVAHYERRTERDRLYTGVGPLERERTREVLLRHLPRPPAVVLDVGGGAGVYALWLAAAGYEVHLRDAVPSHIDQAIEAAHEAGETLASIAVGDARDLDLGDDKADVVLMLGPLYHLQEAEDRRRALEEARRVLRGEGLLAAAAISRYAALIYGLKMGHLEDPGYLQVFDKVEKTGRFDPRPQDGFTRAYLHQPNELRDEVASAGFEVEDLVGVEGGGSFFDDFEERWADPAKREAILEAARRTERVPELLGLSPHTLLIAHRPQTGNERRARVR